MLDVIPEKTPKGSVFKKTSTIYVQNYLEQVLGLLVQGREILVLFIMTILCFQLRGNSLGKVRSAHTFGYICRRCEITIRNKEFDLAILAHA